MATTDTWDSPLSYQTHNARYRTLVIPEMSDNPRHHDTRTHADLSVHSHGRWRVDLRPPGINKNRLANYLEGKMRFCTS